METDTCWQPTFKLQFLLYCSICSLRNESVALRNMGCSVSFWHISPTSHRLLWLHTDWASQCIVNTSWTESCGQPSDSFWLLRWEAAVNELTLITPYILTYIFDLYVRIIEVAYVLYVFKIISTSSTAIIQLVKQALTMTVLMTSQTKMWSGRTLTLTNCNRM